MPPGFSAIFRKGDNFCDCLFAFLNTVLLSTLLKERICSEGGRGGGGGGGGGGGWGGGEEEILSLRVDPYCSVGYALPYFFC